MEVTKENLEKFFNGAFFLYQGYIYKFTVDSDSSSRKVDLGYLTRDCYYCNVKTWNREGFKVYTYFFGKKISAFIPWEKITIQ